MSITRRIGRPPKFTPRLAQRICELLATSLLNVSDICAATRISVDTFYRWQRERPEFAESIARAWEPHYAVMGDHLIEHADQNVIVGDRSDNARVRQLDLQVRTRQWMLERRVPAEYGNRIRVDADVEFAMPDIQPLSVTDAQAKLPPTPSRAALPAHGNGGS